MERQLIKAKNTERHYLENRTMSCGVTVHAQSHKHTDKGHWGGIYP